LIRIARTSTLDWMLAVAIALSAYLALAIPLPSNLVGPGFSSFVLLQYYPFFIAYSFCMTCIGALWFRRGENAAVSLALVTIFSILTISLWGVKDPGGKNLFSGIAYGVIANQYLSSGHLFLQGWGEYPSVFVVSTFLSRLTGGNLFEVFAFLDAYGAVFVGVFYFLLVNLFVKSARASAVGATLAIIADEELTKINEFPPYFGVLFCLILVYLMFKLSSATRSNALIVFSLVSLGAVLTYPGTLFIIFLIAIATTLAEIQHSRPFNRLVFVIAPLLAWVAWSVYMTTFVQYGGLFVDQLLRVLFGPQSSVVSHSGSQSFGFYVFQLLSSNLTSLPYSLGLLLPIWFFAFFGGGSIVWFYTGLRGHRKTPPLSLYFALALAALLLIILQYPTGTGWVRVLPLIAPFMSVAILSVFSIRSRSKLLPVLVIVLVLALPTIIAYTPTQGSQFTTYSWGFASGDFLESHLAGNSVYLGGGVSTLNLSLYTRIVPGIDPSGGLTPEQAEQEEVTLISEFFHSRVDSILAVSSVFYDTWSHLYGLASASYVKFIVANATSSSDLVYSNGIVSLWGR